MKILLVDDDPIILEILCQFLWLSGEHEVRTAQSAPAALAEIGQAAGAAFDCFMLDIQMPDGDGMSLAAHIRKLKLYSATPIVMLTAMSEKRYIDAAFAAGATDYVTKPFDLTDLKMRFGLIEQLVLSRQQAVRSARPAGGMLRVGDAVPRIDPKLCFTPEGIEHVIPLDALRNYVAQLSRSALFGSTLFAFALRKLPEYCQQLSAEDFRLMIADVASGIAQAFADRQIVISYAGEGTFACITSGSSRPDMSIITERVNLALSKADIMSRAGAALHPRLSAGSAIRFVWKSNGQIAGALEDAIASAQDAAAEHERLKFDFFEMGKTA